jgi:hypothetical protein
MKVQLFAVGMFMLCGVTYGTDSGAEKPPLTAVMPSATPDALAALLQTAAIVEGTVASLQSEYTEEMGPWTNVHLTNVVVHRGKVLPVVRQPTMLVLRQKGGEYPDGGFLVVSPLPEFIPGKRYLMFLRNTAWFLSPVVSNAALRVESIDNREILVSQGDGAVVSFSSAGISASEPLYERSERPTFLPPGRARIPSRPVPKNALGISGFLAQVSRELQEKGFELGGRFYDEPFTKSRITPLSARTGQTNPENRAADIEPSTPDNSARK